MLRGRQVNALSLLKDDATVLTGLVDRRFLWGGFGLFTSLNTDITALLSELDAGRWIGTIGDAQSSTHRYSPRELQALDEEPDLKRGPRGLRDLQRAIWANTPASGRPTSRTQASLIEAHRFLWLVRCHLHLLADRAEDRLSLSFQSDITRRLGMDAPQRSAAHLLLDLFRYHRRNVLAANGSGMHGNFSTKYMREVGGKEYFEKLMDAFKAARADRIAV